MPFPSDSLPDTAVFDLLDQEMVRQTTGIQLIASENFTSPAVMRAVGSILTNKYSEGYPGKRYYGGNAIIDSVESLAIERVKALFGADHANVQPHSGANANMCAYQALLQPGDTVLGLSLDHGGHLTHGSPVNASGKLYHFVAYKVTPGDERIDMDQVRDLALQHRPKMIVAGTTSYPRRLDPVPFKAIADEVGAHFMVDMAHFSGLVAAGLHPNPVPHATVVTSTTHKTLAGPRGGIILAGTEDNAKKFQSAVFPGQQGGPLMHVIAAKAAAFRIAATPEFKERQERTLRGASILADRLTADDSKAHGIDVLTGGTDVHLVLADLRHSEINGQQAEDALHEVGITVNRNSVPFDPRPPMVTSGLRIGTPALATRGFGDVEFTEVADVIAEALKPGADIQALRTRVGALTQAFPLYSGLHQ